MFDNNNNGTTEGVTVFRCENGYGLEVISTVGEVEEGNYLVKRYVATSLEAVCQMIQSYFTEGSI